MIKRSSGVPVLWSFTAIFVFSVFSQQTPPDAVQPEMTPAAAQYVSIRLGQGFWHIEDTIHKTYRDSMYLVEGDTTAALIDTGMGSGDLIGYVRTLTHLPIVVLITHGHSDHTGQANQFSTVYFPQKDSGMKTPFDPSKTKPLGDGQKIDLGGKALEVIEIPGHTAGSVAFLDAKDRRIFTGDAIGSGAVWNHINGTRPLIEYLTAVRRLESRMPEFDSIYGGHYWQSNYKPLPAAYVSDMRKATEGVFSGDIIAKSYNIGGSGWAAEYGSATVVYNAMNLYEPGKHNKNEYTLVEVVPDVILIRDYTGFNCAYLVKGYNKAILVDTAMGDGNLQAIVQKHAGNLPVELILTHGHSDHTFSANQFKTVYMNRKDDGRLPRQVNPSGFQDIKPGDGFDLGGITLKAYELPGHTPGSMVFVSSERRILFSGDAAGTQSTKGGLWLQLPGCLYVDEYQSVLKDFIAKTKGQFDAILTGHNAGPVGAKYLDSLVLAAQKVIDQGEAALVPSIRPAGIRMVVYGDDDDPFAASINLDPKHLLSGNKK